MLLSVPYKEANHHFQGVQKSSPQYLSVFSQSLIKREVFKIKHPVDFKKLQDLRKETTPKGYSLRPFDKHRCIFVHVPKCAGISISKSLFGNLAGGHQRIRDYQLIFNAYDFLNYFKFTVVRNPWDRLFSAFSFLKKGGMNEQDKAWAEENLADCPDFETFVSTWLSESNIRLKNHFFPQMEYLYLANNQLGVDFVGYYESLNEDFLYICNKLKIKADLSKLNVSRPQKDDYRRHYTDKTRQMVTRVYQDDIQSLGYSFDQAAPRK